MMLFPKALFLATNFPKNRYKFNFSIEFSSKFFSKFPQPIVFLIQTRENLTQSFEIFLQNRRKYCIFSFFLRNFLHIFKNSPFQKLSFVRGLSLRTPYKAGHNLEPSRNFFLLTPLFGGTNKKLQNERRTTFSAIGNEETGSQLSATKASFQSFVPHFPSVYTAEEQKHEEGE